MPEVAWNCPYGQPKAAYGLEKDWYQNERGRRVHLTRRPRNGFRTPANRLNADHYLVSVFVSGAGVP